MTAPSLSLLVLPGDGIGPEIVDAGMTALDALDARFGLGVRAEEMAVGFASLKAEGSTFPDRVIEAARRADATILGPTDTAAYPPLAEGGVNPSAAMRSRLELYANMRPSRTRPGVPSLVRQMDLVIARENTEGFYADRNMFAGSGEFMATADVALAVRKITRQASERIARAACRLAMKRRRRLTIVHKANVLKHSDGLFESVALQVAAEFPEIRVDDAHVDAMASLLVRTPEAFDVVVTTNMFGDILSNEAAELSGGIGLGGSINHGDRLVMAQAAHGSAPDIAGKGIANPTSLLVSVAQMLEYVGERDQRNVLTEAARCLQASVDRLLADPASRTADLGGPLGTKAFAARLAEAIAREP